MAEECARLAARRGQVSVVCRRLEKYHLLLHLNKSKCL